MPEEKSAFIICPVREVTEEERQFIEDYVSKLEVQDYKVHYPARDTNQDDSIGTRICTENRDAIRNAREVHIYWNGKSSGSLFDFGMAFMAEKPFVLFNRDSVQRTQYKSFQNVLLELDAKKIPENNELFNEYQKGYINCLCNVISKGCKKISDDLDDILYGIEADENELKQAIDDIASKYNVKLHVRYYPREIRTEGDVFEIKPNGTEQKVAGPGKFRFEAYSLVLYKNNEDLARFLELAKIEKPDEDCHRELGRLYGYSEEEIDDFIIRVVRD